MTDAEQTQSMVTDLLQQAHHFSRDPGNAPCNPLLETAAKLFRNLYQPGQPYDLQQPRHSIMLQAGIAAAETGKSTLTALMKACESARGGNTKPDGLPYPCDDPRIRQSAEACNILNTLASAMDTSRRTLNDVVNTTLKNLEHHHLLTEEQQEQIKNEVQSQVADRLNNVARAKDQVLQKRNATMDQMAKDMHERSRSAQKFKPFGAALRQRGN